MWRYKIFSIYIVLFLLSTLHTSVYAQYIGNSPYSRFGLGDLNDNYFAQNAGMGGVGIAHSEYLQVNNLNPALLFKNRNTIFEGSSIAQLKVSSTSEGLSRQTFGAGFNYISLAFPVNKFWTAQVGIAPYSTVNYSNSYKAKIDNTDFTATYSFTGSGGLNNLYIASGFKILDEFYAGIKVSYLFGSIIDETSAILNTNLSTNPTVNDYFSTRFKSLLFQPGLYYRIKVKEEVYVGIGLTYSIPASLQINNFNSVQLKNSSGTVITADTLSRDVKSTATIPQKIGFGLSIGKAYKWSLSTDFNFQSWSSWKQADTLANSLTMGLGGEFTPDVNALKGFAKRITYRAGFRYSQTPYMIKGTQLSDMSVSIGFSMPFNRAATSLNLALIVGKRGTLTDNLIEEKYFKTYLGITINDRWFVKRKID